MIKEAIEKVLELKKPETITVDGREYFTQTLNGVTPPKIDWLHFNSLKSLVTYIKSDLDAEFRAGSAVHVKSHKEVALIGTAREPWKDREVIAVADLEHHAIGFRFGSWYERETFIIALQSQFQDCLYRERVLKLVGNIQGQEVRTSRDDGVSQSVEARQGVAFVENADVPNPVSLQPFRTFREVDQPKSKFVLRLRQNRGDSPDIALFEADGEAWKLDAISNIAGFLKANLPEDFLVLS